jgi:hypothetical protein
MNGMFENWIQNLGQKSPGPGAYGSVRWRWILGKWDVKMWVNLVCDWNGCRAVLNVAMNFRLPLKAHISSSELNY